MTPPSCSRWNLRIAWAIVAASAIVATWHQWRVTILPEDDAFITYRYVNNVVTGHGLVYNPGQRVCGVSSPFYLLFLSSIAAIFKDSSVDVLAVRSNSFPLVAVSVLCFLLLRRWTGRPILAAAVTSAILLNHHILERAADGMESYWFVGWLLLTFWASLNRRELLASGACGLACLTRPEGILIVPILAWIHHRNPAMLIRMAMGFLLVVLPWVIFAWLYYGTPIPHSITAKASGLYPLPPAFALHQIFNQFGLPWTALSISATAIFCITMSRRERLPTTVPLLWFPFVAYWLLILLYAVGNPLMFPWYYPPLWVLGAMLITIGFTVWAHPLTNANQTPSLSLFASYLPHLVSAALIVIVGFELRVSTADRARHDPARLRILAYKNAAHVLNERVRPGELVLSPEIGALGFWYKGAILDACGLVSPEAIPFLPVPLDQRVDRDVGAIPVQLVEKYRPQWLVTLSLFVVKGLARSPWFQSEYEFAETIPLPEPLWGDRSVYIVRRKPPATSRQWAPNPGR